jgi:hypothetical protein
MARGGKQLCHQSVSAKSSDGVRAGCRLEGLCGGSKRAWLALSRKWKWRVGPSVNSLNVRRREQVPSYKDGKQDKEKEQDGAEEPKPRPRPVRTPGLVIHHIPQRGAWAGRMSPNNFIRSEHGRLAPLSEVYHRGGGQRVMLEYGEAIPRAAHGDPVNRPRREAFYPCPHPERHISGDAHPSLKTNRAKNAWAFLFSLWSRQIPKNVLAGGTPGRS